MAADLAPGCAVRIRGLVTATRYNDCVGTVLSFEAKAQRSAAPHYPSKTALADLSQIAVADISFSDCFRDVLRSKEDRLRRTLNIFKSVGLF